MLSGQFDSDFEKKALELFQIQAQENPIYSAYLQGLRIRPPQVGHLKDIPFMPIRFFKEHTVKTGNWQHQSIFTSSGTTGSEVSNHYVHDVNAYLKRCEFCFEHFYGPVEDWTILALLPSYLEREGSSLVAMARHFIDKSKAPESGFFLHNLDALSQTLKELKQREEVLLIGVTFALLDFAAQFPGNYPKLTVMETGGMKGRRKEMTRQEVHRLLQEGLDVPQIHSEYGMTELLSQAYSKGSGQFYCPPGMQVFLRDMNDPFEMHPARNYGVLCVIDFANEKTCAFIETQDLGSLHPDGSFSVLGRMDNAEIRGCNLMIF
jgi:hypothetical protein